MRGEKLTPAYFPPIKFESSSVLIFLLEPWELGKGFPVDRG
jgi:hypothetical protein